jgi:HSP20 family protein
MVGMLGQEDWDVRRELGQLQQDMDTLTRRVRRPVSRRGARVFPSIIISATDRQLFVRAEVPGMELGDFDIRVSGDILTVQGSRTTGDLLEGGWYHRRERDSGSFSRAIRLPAEVEGEAAEASYEAGVLTVSLPLKRAAKPVEIPVQVAEGYSGRKYGT